MELPPLISALLSEDAYPPGTRGPVKLIQTHISYILLTLEFAYKIKKPVDFGFLDFTTLDKRLRFCEEEVRLNRRLAQDVYIGVVKVARMAGGFRMEGEGEAAEYAVKMRRIPDDSLLVNRLAEGTVDAGDMERIARAVAAFHKNAETGARISSFGSPEIIRKNTNENFEQTEAFIGRGRTISAKRFKGIKAYTEDFLKVNEGLFKERMEKGFVRDCHGDIHCEHISLDKDIHIFDCIEFNERFRFSDVVADAAFLSMDLDFHNRRDLALAFEKAYFDASGDGQGWRLLDFYKCYRAYVRGKVEGFKSAEPEVGEDEKRLAEAGARRHFHLSGLYASGGFRPMLVIVRGLSGTGKSTVAGGLSRETGFVHLSTDGIRKELAGVPPGARRPEPFEAGIYSKEFTERTYAELIKRASALLAEGRSVILDGTFSKKRFVEAASEAAQRHNASFHVMECEAGDEAVRERMRKRSAQEAKGPAVSDADWEIYLRQKEGYECWDGGALRLDAAVAPSRLLSIISTEIFD